MLKLGKYFCSELSNYLKFKDFKNPAFLNVEFPGVTLV